MAHIPDGPPQVRTLIDRLIACLWWLIFLGGVGAGAATGVVLALWLALPPLPGLLLVAACWLAGNAAGWQLAARADAAMTRRIKQHRKRIRAAHHTVSAPSHRAFPRSHGTGWLRSPGPACP
jgi:hypothetical protein